MSKLVLGKGLELPEDAITQVFAFMGRRGGGKSYAASKLAELLLDAGGQVVILDPVGSFWGLRLAADGKGPGFAIPVLGGDHGDLDLVPEAGAVVADLIATTGTSAVLDVSSFRKGERQAFVTAFAEQFFHRKKTLRTPVHVFLEEAHLVVPQRIFTGQERMVGAVEDLVRLGRNYGIGVSLISQRPQAVAKDVLNQAECLLTFQLSGKQERKAIEAWIEEREADDTDEAISLSALEVGTALVWSPQWLRFRGRVAIAKKRTFDASATPEIGAKTKARELAPVDLDALRGSMEAAAAATKAKDPTALRKRAEAAEAELGRARAELSRLATAARAPVDLGEVRALVRRAVDWESDLGSAARRIGDLIKAIDHAVDFAMRSTPGAMTHDAAGVPVPTNGANGHGKWPPDMPTGGPPRKFARPAVAREPSQGADSPGKGPEAFLVALAVFPDGTTVAQAALLAGYTPGSSTTRNYLSLLRKQGYIEGGGGPRGTIRLTEAGQAARPTGVGPADPGMLRDRWIARAGGGPGKLLTALVDRYPRTMTRADLEGATGYSASSSTMRNYLSELRTSGLITGRGDALAAAEELFPA